MNRWSLLAFAWICSCQVMASEPQVKRTLKNSMEEVFLVQPGEATHLGDWFSQGMWYGRLRFHHFAWQWEEEDDSKQNHATHGLGGSLIYRTADLKGWSMVLGFYGVESPFSGLNPDKEDVGLVKAGKDVFNRNAIRNGGLYDGDFGIASLAQAYLQFQTTTFLLRAGRQLHDGFLTRSNDTKMIPNAFQGITASWKFQKNHDLQGAWFSRQKLRDHEDFHDVIAVNGWEDNDDSAGHKGLTGDRLDEAGISTDLRIVGLNSTWNENWKTDAWVYRVPDLFTSTSVEVNFTQSMASDHKIRIGFRGLMQGDDGAGSIGGAALCGKLAGETGPVDGYEKADSVDANLWAGRLMWLTDGASVMLGYSAVGDKADLIAPWRGFPTGGYTRSMGQYNWEANTRSWMLQAILDFEQIAKFSGFRMAADMAWMDWDEAKIAAGSVGATDRWLIHTDFWYRVDALPGLEMRIRAMWVNAHKTPAGSDPSYRELRTEFNYLF